MLYNGIEVIQANDKEQRKLLITYQETDDEAVLNKLIGANICYIRMLARKFSYRIEDINDLTTVGILGLVKAIEHYDFRKDCTFLSYAQFWIRSKMRIEHTKLKSVVTVPDCVQLDIMRINKMLKENLSYAQIAKKLNLRVETVKNRLTCQYVDNSLTDVLMNKLTSNDNTEQVMDYNFLLEFIEEARRDSILNEKEYKVLTSRFALFGKKQKKLRELGEEMNLSRERIRQLEGQAISSLKEYHTRITNGPVRKSKGVKGRKRQGNTVGTR